MWGRIRDYWIRRSIENRRAIFRYFDGRRSRRIDPLVALRRLQSHPQFDPETTPAFAADGDTEACEVMADAARIAFDVPALDATGGLTEQECIGVMAAFVDYCDDLQKKSGWTPTLPRRSESEPSSESTTKPESDCSSTPDAPTCDRPLEPQPCSTP